jgi:hypothetical protein
LHNTDNNQKLLTQEQSNIPRIDKTFMAAAGYQQAAILEEKSVFEERIESVTTGIGLLFGCLHYHQQREGCGTRGAIPRQRCSLEQHYGKVYNLASTGYRSCSLKPGMDKIKRRIFLGKARILIGSTEHATNELCASER